MEQWNEIRRKVKVEGASKRSIMRAYGLHYRTLEKMLAHPEPPGYRQSRKRTKPGLGPYVGFIEAMLEEDKKLPRKQKYTAKRIYDRLKVQHGYKGGESTVRSMVRMLRQKTAEVFVPIHHKPGEGQVDFGFADVVIAGRQQQAALFTFSLPYSSAKFMCGFPEECTERFQQGHVDAFSFFGGVPHRIAYDNSKIAVISVGRGRPLSRFSAHRRCDRIAIATTVGRNVRKHALLERKPGAFDTAKPLRDWHLPDAFDVLRRRLESEDPDKGLRDYIKTLRLLEHFSLAEVHRGIERALAAGATDSEAIRLFVEHGRTVVIPLFCLDGHPHLKSVHVRNVNLRAYASLVTSSQVEVQS